MTEQVAIHELVAYQESFFTPVLSDSSISWEKEKQFAIQALQKSNYLADIARKNQASLQNAIINIASIGVSLNPAAKHAYLVGRGGAVCLDISYMGLLHIAMLDGGILWGQAKVVYSNDFYENQGLDKQPIHKYKAFGDRGEPVGCYCTVRASNGDYITEEMNSEQILDIRNRSTAWQAWVNKKKKCPWVTDELEMWRKTVVKRASKYWPNSSRLDKAVEVLNNDNQEGLASEPVDITPIGSESLESLLEVIESKGRTNEQFCTWATQTFKRPIQSVSELYETEYEQSFNMVNNA